MYAYWVWVWKSCQLSECGESTAGGRRNLSTQLVYAMCGGAVGRKGSTREMKAKFNEKWMHNVQSALDGVLGKITH